MRELQPDRNFLGESPLTSQEISEIILERETERKEREYEMREKQRENKEIIKYTPKDKKVKD